MIRALIAGKIFQLEFQTYLLLFLIAVTAHNTEEALFLPEWAKSIGIFIEPPKFIFSVCVLTVLAYVATFLSIKQNLRGCWTYFITGYSLTMLLNVLFPHVLASLYFQDYAPGTGTALFLILPTTLLVLRKSIEDKHVDKSKFYVVGPMVVLVIAASIPVLFSSYDLLASQ